MSKKIGGVPLDTISRLFANVPNQTGDTASAQMSRQAQALGSEAVDLVEGGKISHETFHKLFILAIRMVEFSKDIHDYERSVLYQKAEILKARAA